MATEPVCDFRFTPDDDFKIRQDYRGQVYYFRTEECRELFLQNPEAIRKEEVQYTTEGETQSI